MKFEEVVGIKEAYCCEKCTSFEYDLPCRVDLKLLESLILMLKQSEKLINISADDELFEMNKLFHSNLNIKMQFNEDTKIEARPNTRWLKLCVLKNDTITKKKIEEKLISWISDNLNMEIER